MSAPVPFGLLGLAPGDFQGAMRQQAARTNYEAAVAWTGGLACDPAMLRNAWPYAAAPAPQGPGLVDQWILSRAKEWAGARDRLFWVWVGVMAAGLLLKAVV